MTDDNRAQVIAPADWPGLPHLRPGLFRRKDAAPLTVDQELAATHPAPPDRILFCREVDTETARALCSPVKLALGITQAKPGGQVHPSWRHRVTHGAGVRGSDGRITESVVIRFEHPSGRSAVCSWTRRAVNPALMIALRRELAVIRPATLHPWPMVAAVLRALPAPDWSTWLTADWTRDPDTGRATNSPSLAPARYIRDITRIGDWT
jgi:hypothetical protein